MQSEVALNCKLQVLVYQASSECKYIKKLKIQIYLMMNYFEDFDSERLHCKHTDESVEVV